MTPLTRLAAIVLLAMVIGAVLGVGLFTRLQAPPPPAPIATPPAAPKAEPTAVYTPVEVSDLPGWTQDSVAQVLTALKRSCTQFSALAPDAVVGHDVIARPAQAWQTACKTLEQTSDGDAAVRAALAAAFTVYRVSQTQTDPDNKDNDRGTFTAYYETDLNGSLEQGGNFHVPIYGVPRNLVTINLKDFLPPAVALPGNVPTNLVGRLVPNDNQTGGALKPYFTRAQIDSESAIADDADVLLWADDPVAVHILHIQGSGRVTLPDGQIVRVGFAGHNGRSFRGIGSILLEAGALKPGGASMVAVRDWLQRHPVDAVDYMNRNTRYIFFRRLNPAEAEDGPLGAQGVSLTPGRSLAVDPRFIPLGAPLWLETTDPDNVPIQRLMVAQDVGAAITGVVRGDIFWGHGEEAFLKAGRMKSAGRYFIFVPKAVAAPAPVAAPVGAPQ